MLKRILLCSHFQSILSAAFGRLCVETQKTLDVCLLNGTQPPSGGCVLKLYIGGFGVVLNWSAAFGRLCVETMAWRIITMA